MRDNKVKQLARLPLPISARRPYLSGVPKSRRVATGALVIFMAASQIMPSYAAINNTVKVTGTGPGGTAVEGTASATVTVQVAAPAITIKKIATLVDSASGSLSAAAKGDAGETINYVYMVTNSGNVTLKNVSLKDVHDGVNPAGLVFVSPTLTDNGTAGDSPNNNQAQPNGTLWPPAML